MAAVVRRRGGRMPRPGATRDLILDAAEASFAARGFSGTSVREIAAAAGLRNQASLYNHFRNKRALYEATLARGLAPIVDLVAASAPGPGGLGSARAGDAFLDRLLDYLAARPHLPRLIQRAALDDGHRLHTALSELLRPLYAGGVQALAAAGNGWDKTQLPFLAAALYQMIFGYFANAELMQAVVHGDPLHPGALARQRRFLKDAVPQLLRQAQADGPHRPAARP